MRESTLEAKLGLKFRRNYPRFTNEDYRFASDTKVLISDKNITTIEGYFMNGIV